MRWSSCVARITPISRLLEIHIFVKLTTFNEFRLSHKGTPWLYEYIFSAKVRRANNFCYIFKWNTSGWRNYLFSACTWFVTSHYNIVLRHASQNNATPTAEATTQKTYFEWKLVLSVFFEFKTLRKVCRCTFFSGDSLLLRAHSLITKTKIFGSSIINVITSIQQFVCVAACFHTNTPCNNMQSENEILAHRSVSLTFTNFKFTRQII